MHTMNKLQTLAILLGLVYAVSARAEVVCGESQYIRNPDDCGSFYECSNGVPILQKCPTGLEFSVISNTCNNPTLAKCGSSGGSNNAPAPPADLPNYYCPEVDGLAANFYPDPVSCSSYYMCAEGKLQHYQCPYGLEYSAEERVCDYPQAGKCKLNNLPSLPSGPTNPNNYYCPEVDGSTPYYYPDPVSCFRYYMCADGKLQHYQCPYGLEYSAEERVCDYPQSAKCKLNNMPSLPSGPTNPNHYYCPEVDGSTPYYYPDPVSCSRYYMCTDGKLQHYQCPYGLEYSAEERVCDYPQATKCILNNIPSVSKHHRL